MKINDILHSVNIYNYIEYSIEFVIIEFIINKKNIFIEIYLLNIVFSFNLNIIGDF